MTRMRYLRRTAWASASALLAAMLGLSAPATADPAGILQLEQVNGVTDGSITLPYNTPGTPLLDHFYFRYLNDDNHLKTLTARPRFSVIDIDFSDSAPIDQYEFRVAHQKVSPTGLSQGSFVDRCKGSCTRPIVRPPGDVVFVITGFRFWYVDLDHHMDAIGIIESNGQLTHWFNDQNDDDEYEVSIDYAWVPRSRFSSVPSISGTVQDAGVVTRSVNAGDKVIRGFTVDNIGSGGGGDNHIKRFGFLTNSTTVDIYYGDKDPADSADWTYQLRYAVLN